MFRKILIANRGEIACRVAATARRMGIRTVAVYSDADAQAKHVGVCDEAVHIGGSAPKDSYLRGDVIIAAAKRCGAEAIHPGYGFLSENEDFAQQCADAGLVFIGPPPAAIKAMGLKAESKQLMEKAGVPLVPGYHGKEQDPALLKREAGRIGYPVLIKASAGGGGKGMRAVLRPEDFDEALASCKREAINSFGDDAVLIERYVQRPRHVEIQVFFDTHGNGVYLFERDCSVQRRHQKVLEEAPAPGMSAERRKQMGEAAVAAARAVGYVGAGTVEFIVESGDAPRDMGADPSAAGPSQGASAPLGGSAARPARSMGADPSAAGPSQGASAPLGGSAARPARSVGAFYFMEMNTRLQVEHPVTEAITGHDLVEWQLRVAAGEPLPVRQDELKIHGHAIEARICAENPDNNFLPATGTLQAMRTPPHVAFMRNADGEPFHRPAAVRIDAGVRKGDAISPFYDSMIAKLIVWGESRAQALARLDDALAQTHIVGLHTNVAFLRRCVRSASFAQADLDTGLIERERAVLFDRRELDDAWLAAGAIAHVLLHERQLAGADPWLARDGWRLNGRARRRFDFRIGAQPLRADLEYMADGGYAFSLNGSQSPLYIEPADNALTLRLGAQRRVLHVYRTGDGFAVFAGDGSGTIALDDVIAHAGEDAHEAGRLSAPMPGKVIALLAQAGDAVKKGQPLVVMEAMKMEHTIAAPAEGKVEALLYRVGDQVPEGAELVRFAQ
jgi:3-methylcrotonyl-CoA carboxylase alpha subunit